MGWQYTPYTIPLAATVVFGIPLIALAATQRGKKGAYTLVALFGTMMVWAGSYALQLSSTDLGLTLFFHAVRFLGPAFVTLAFFVFALQFTGRESMVTPLGVTILAALPAITTFLVWTDVYGFHNLVIVEHAADGSQWLDPEYGPWYFVHAAYSIVLTLAAIGLFVGHSRSTDGSVSKRARLFALSGVFPLAGSGIYVANLTAIDWGPVTSIVSGLIIIAAIFYF